MDLHAPIHHLQAGLPLATQVAWVEFDQLFGSQIMAIGAWGDHAHKLRRSCHNTGQALDLMTSRPAAHDVIVRHALDQRANLKIRRIISMGHVWSRSSSWKPVEYKGSDPHRNHVHLSIDCDL